MMPSTVAHCAGCGEGFKPDVEPFVARLDSRQWHRGCWETVRARTAARERAARELAQERRTLDRQARGY